MGFTQQELAGYLNLCRTQLALFEKGHRSLPWRAMGKWSRVQCCLDDTAALDSMVREMAEGEQAEMYLLLGKEARKMERAACQLKLKLERMQETHRHCARALAFVALAKQLPSNGRVQDMWLAGLEARVLKRSWACRPGLQALVALKLRAIAAMQEELLHNYRIS